MTKIISPLRQRMIDDMTIRNMSSNTQKAYIRALRDSSQSSGAPFASGWCSGAAGYVFLFSLAERHFPNSGFFELAERGAKTAPKATTHFVAASPDGLIRYCAFIGTLMSRAGLIRHTDCATERLQEVYGIRQITVYLRETSE